MKSLTWIIPILLLLFVLVAVYSLESTQNASIHLASNSGKLIGKNPLPNSISISKSNLSLVSNLSRENITK